MLIFEHIRYKNFLSTGNAWTDIELNKHNHTLIVGRNGAGKSTLLDALCFALFNEAYRDINKPMLVNSINRKEMAVELTFSTNGKRYKVIRGIKPAIFEIYRDGELIDQDGTAGDYQTKLDTITRLTKRSFCQIVVLGSASLVPFMMLKTGPRREIIENLLTIQVFSTMNLLLKQRVDTNSKALASVNEDIRVFEGKVEVIEQFNRHIRKQREIQQDANEEQITSYVAFVQDRTLERERSYEVKRELDAKITALEPKKDTLKQYKDLRSQYQAALHVKEKHVSFFDSNETCPSCTQPITEQLKADVAAATGDKIETLRQGIVALDEKITTLEASLRDLEHYKRERTEIERDIAVLTTKISSTEKRIEELRAEKQEIADEMDETIYDEQIAAKKAEREDLLWEQRKLSIEGSMLKDNGIKAAVIKQNLPTINRLVNKFLAAMDFYVNFEFDENFNETIKSRFRDQFTYKSFSQGEKQKIDLSLLFTWRETAKMNNAIATNLLIMDEVLDSSLDITATDQLMKIIFDLTKNTNVFIISHSTDVIDKFNHVIKFEKTKDFSSIVES